MKDIEIDFKKVQHFDIKINPIWLKFIRYCEKINFGELQKVQIQNGLPALIEESRRKIKLG